MPTKLPLDTFDLSEGEVHGRFDWAVRQGNPHWLWPGTTVEAWQSALAQFEVVARQILTVGRARQILQGRPEDIGVAGYTSGLGPLLGFWLGRGLVDACPGIGAMLELHYRHNVLRMDLMSRRAVAVVEHLAECGIEVTVLKGMDTAYSVFPEPGTRPLSDIDLLIDPADRPLANEVLRKIGYLPGRTTYYPPAQNWEAAGASSTPRSLAFVHRDDPWSIDLQSSLNRRYSYGSPILKLDCIKTSFPLDRWRLSPAGRTLGPEALVVHLACHASCGLQSLTLLRLVELVMTIRLTSDGGRFSWDGFEELAEQARALAMLYPALHLAERLAPGTIPEDTLRRCQRQAPEPVHRVLDRLHPSNAHRVLRCSLEERFMWSPTRLRRLVQVVRELSPPGIPVSALPGIYRTRAWRVLRGTLTR